MKRKLICVLLTLCLCAGLVPMTAAGADPYPTGTVVIPLTEAGVPDGDGGALWSYDAAGETLTLNAGHSFAVDGVCPVRVICKGSIVGGTYTGDVEVYNGGSVSGGLFSGRLLEKLGAKIEDAEFPVTFELNGGVYQYAAGTVIPRNSWIPFSSFGGTFEGGGHKIENLYVQTIDRNAGLFDNSYGTIRDVEIASGSVAIRKLTHAGFYAGGIAARSSGTIERCVNRADISANDDNQVASSGSNALNLGGIAGFLGTSLLGAAVSAVTDCVNFGAVRNLGDSNVCEVSVGGIAGYQHSGMISGKASLISGCVNRGSVSAPNPIYSVWAGGIVGTAAGNSAAVTATAASCENRGSVSSGFAAGGIAGYVSGAQVYNSYNTGAVAGGGNAGEVAGLLYYSRALAENCYSRGAVSGSGSAGGVIGLASYGTARKCYYLDAAAAGTCGAETHSPTIEDCTDFTHSASGCTLNVPVGSPNDLLTALRTWVEAKGDPAYFDWMADTQEGNYPVFAACTVTVERGSGSGSYRTGSTVAIRADAPGAAEEFAGWTSADGVLFADSASASTSFVMPAQNVTVTATYRQPPAPAVDYYTLRFETNGGSEVPSVRRAGGSRVSLNQTTARAGYAFTGWYLDAALTQRAEAVTLDRDKSVYAGWRRDAADPDDTGVSVRLDTGAHEKYLTGYPDGAFRPESPMTRAEAAQMFYNLLLDKPAAANAGFADVEPAAWYAEAVNALAALGIIRGESEHRFAPEQSVTRAEFTAMVMRFAKPEAIGENRFRDIAEADWYYADVAGAVRYGWISGYPNGSFRPGSTITRAEAAAVVNRMLARSGDEHYIRTHAESLARFADLPADHWAYFEIMEAANGHEYDRLDGRESWKQT